MKDSDNIITCISGALVGGAIGIGIGMVIQRQRDNKEIEYYYKVANETVYKTCMILDPSMSIVDDRTRTEWRRLGIMD